MLRHRFMPHLDGLEHREMLSTAAPTSALLARSTVPLIGPATPAITKTTTVTSPRTLTNITTSTPRTLTNITTSTPRTTTATTTTVNSPRVTTTVSTTTQQNPRVSLLRAARIEQLPVYLYRVDPNRTVPQDLIVALQNDLRAIENQLTIPPPGVFNAFNLQLRAAMPHASLNPVNATRMNTLFGRILETAGAPADAIDQFKADMNQLAKLDSFTSNPAYLAANDYAIMAQLSLGIGLKN